MVRGRVFRQGGGGGSIFKKKKKGFNEATKNFFGASKKKKKNPSVFLLGHFSVYLIFLLFLRDGFSIFFFSYLLKTAQIVFTKKFFRSGAVFLGGGIVKGGWWKVWNERLFIWRGVGAHFFSFDWKDYALFVFLFLFPFFPFLFPPSPRLRFVFVLLRKKGELRNRFIGWGPVRGFIPIFH